MSNNTADSTILTRVGLTKGAFSTHTPERGGLGRVQGDLLGPTLNAGAGPQGGLIVVSGTGSTWHGPIDGVVACWAVICTFSN